MPRLSVSGYRSGMDQPRHHTPLDVRNRPELDDALVALVRLLARQAAQEVFGNADADPGIERDGASHERQDGS